MAHRSPITCIDHHPGTDLVATGGYDGRAVAWRGTAPIWSTEFDDLVNDVRFDPSGARVAVAVADGHAYVLDASDGSVQRKVGPHGDDVNAVRWTPDGNTLICVMDHLDTTVCIWPLTRDDARAAQVLVGHEGGVMAVAIDPSGGRIATAAEDGTARVWDLASSTATLVLHHPADPEALDWSPDGSLIATGCNDGIARLWDATTGALLHSLDDARAAVRFVRFAPTGKRLLSGSYDATMRVYEVTTRRVTDALQRDYQWERSACFAGDDVLVGSFGAQPVRQRLAASQNSAAADLPGGFALTSGINAMCAAAGLLYVGRDDGAVVQLGEGNQQRVLERHPSIVNAVAVSPDGAVIASADYRGGLSLTPLVSGALLSGALASGALASDPTLRTRTADGGPVNSIAWHPSGEELFSAGYDGVIRRWTPDGRCVDQRRAHHGPIKSIAWCAAADALIAGSSDGTLSAWRDGAALWHSEADGLVLVNAVACADDDADGTVDGVARGVVVTVSRDRLVRRWRAADGALIEVLPEAHTKSVKATAVAADGRTILTGSYDGTALLWQRAASGTWSWRVLRAHGKPGVPAVVLAQGLIATAGWDGSVARWRADGSLEDRRPLR